MADEMNGERATFPEGITRDDTVHGVTYFTAEDMATASAQGFRDGVASLSAPLQSALDVIERWARDAYVVCGKPATQDGFEAAWKAEDADAYAVWVAGRASLAANAPAATAADGKWYMLSRDGMATLCADRDDAMTEAASADKLYPNGAPHRALQLVAANAGSPEINGQLYTALNNLFTHLGMEGCITADHAFVWDAMTALKRIDGGVHLDNLAVPVDPDAHRDDMLAAVQLLEGGEWAEHFAKTPIGMRLEDQITKLHNEVAANAGGDPVAWVLTEQLTKRETTTRGYLWFSDPVNCMWTPLYTHPSPPEGMVGGWRPIETALRDGTHILGYNAEFGARETRMNKYSEGSPGYAEWKAGRGPLECGWDWQEPKKGWVFSWTPTHWMPIPAPPASEAKEPK